MRLLYQKKVPAIEIAGLCLPLKPQKENVYAGLQQNIFHTTMLMIDGTTKRSCKRLAGLNVLG